jgi:predicted amidophosphoribosyltransferase
MTTPGKRSYAKSKGATMSEYCPGCGATTHEDDSRLCAKCEAGERDKPHPCELGHTKPLHDEISQLRTDNATLAAEVLMRRKIGPRYRTQSLVDIATATDASGALDRAKGGE